MTHTYTHAHTYIYIYIYINTYKRFPRRNCQELWDGHRNGQYQRGHQPGEWQVPGHGRTAGGNP